MKKLCSFILCILLLFPLVAAAQSAVDLASLTNDELLSLWQAAGERLKQVGAYPFIALSKGDQGIDVVNAQQRLGELFFFSGEPTGKFDTNTQKAVKAFEKANGLKTDGLLSIDEQHLLYSSEAQAKATHTPSPSPTPAPTPVPENAVLQISSVTLFERYNYKRFKIEAKNMSVDDTIDAFDIITRAYDRYGTNLSWFATSTYVQAFTEQNCSIMAGKSYRMGSYYWDLFGWNNAVRIEVAVSKYHTTDGDTIIIPPEEYIWVTGEL